MQSRIHHFNTDILLKRILYQGYHGLLCGACDEDYGRTNHGTCVQCSISKWSVFLPILDVVWTTTIIVIVIYIALSTARNIEQDVDVSLNLQETLDSNICNDESTMQPLELLSPSSGYNLGRLTQLSEFSNEEHGLTKKGCQTFCHEIFKVGTDAISEKPVKLS